MSPGNFFLAISAAEEAQLKAKELCETVRHRLAENRLLAAMNRRRLAEIKLFVAERSPKITQASEVHVLLDSRL